MFCVHNALWLGAMPRARRQAMPGLRPKVWLSDAWKVGI